MNTTESDWNKQLANPPLLPDPVFPHEGYLALVTRGFLAAVLHQNGQPESVLQHARVHFSDSCSTCVGVGNIVGWAFELAANSPTGTTGRDVFLKRVEERIREQDTPHTVGLRERLLGRGALRIQIESEAHPPQPPHEYQICKLVDVGYYVAELVLPP